MAVPPAKMVLAEHNFFVDGKAGKLHVSDGGSGGVPVLFIHGLGGDIETWRAQLDHVRGFRRAIAMEARGHGQSAHAPLEGYTIAGLADDIDSVARALKLNRFILVGHSISGTALQTYAAQHPETLAGLVFADAIGDFRRAGPPADIDEMVKGDAALSDPAKQAQEMQPMLKTAKPATRANVLRSLAELDPLAFGALRTSMARFVPPADLSKSSIPIFVIEADGNHSPARFSVLDPSAPVITLLGVSHWLMLDDPDAFNRALDGFLTAH